MNSKKILTIIYLNRSIALAKVSFSGKTANVSNYSEFALPDGTIENSVVYDPRTVSGIIKEYINAVSFKQIDKSVACIPDNKVKIIFYKYNESITESQNEEELTNLVEKVMNIPMSNLSVITDTFTSNAETYTVVSAIRKEILDPYITSSRFGASIFPVSSVLSQALSKNLTESSVVIYPRGNSLRFFIWIDGHVIANDVDGKNILEIDNNLSNGIREIIGYGESLSHRPLKKVLFIEGKKVAEEDIKPFMPEETGFDIEFFRTKDASLDQYKFLALKGLIKKINDTGLEKPSIKKRMTSVTKGVSSLSSSPSNHLKVAILSTAIVILLIGLAAALGWTYYSQNQRKLVNNSTNPTSTALAVTDTPTTTPIERINLSTIVTPTISVSSTPVSTASYTPQTTKVQVLNGTGTAGDATKVTNIIQALGFQMQKPGDKPPYNTTKTQVLYMSGYQSMADIILNKLKERYSLIEEKQVTSQAYNIIVVTGEK